MWRKDHASIGAELLHKKLRGWDNAGVIKKPCPTPVAFCWYHGEELGQRQITAKGCMDPEKQLCFIDQNGKHVCKHLHRYGELRQGRYLTLQEVYDKIRKLLESNGMRLEGRKLAIVKDLPDGRKKKFMISKARKKKENSND